MALFEAHSPMIGQVQGQPGLAFRPGQMGNSVIIASGFVEGVSRQELPNIKVGGMCSFVVE